MVAITIGVSYDVLPRENVSGHTSLGPFITGYCLGNIPQIVTFLQLLFTQYPKVIVHRNFGWIGMMQLKQQINPFLLPYWEHASRLFYEAAAGLSLKDVRSNTKYAF